ncbi:MAG: GyrI-like domain-containing protein [Longibaculum muris]|uniref:GyrI-like domain-containing protein n=1 Tax=Longibaculum muris TaxID=1796628 RepID=UPI002E75FFF3|nr:GyrI-like domain-containing protein [Longibaculum muris]MED9811206.1 GyrI-like domain-containing protein [Longibaculum muris]
MKEGIRKEYKKQYDASTKRIDVVDVPEFNFVMIDGIGNPNVEEFKLKSDALHILSKAIKDYFKQEMDLLYLISPLEGLWDTYDNSQFDVTRKKMIKFTLMIAQPKILDEKTFEMIKEYVAAKRDNPYIVDAYLKKMEEGRCVQMMHKGAYNTEIDTTKQIMEYITVQGMKLIGLHHEIYLNNPEKVATEKLKTIVRYAIEEGV